MRYRQEYLPCHKHPRCLNRSCPIRTAGPPPISILPFRQAQCRPAQIQDAPALRSKHAPLSMQREPAQVVIVLLPSRSTVPMGSRIVSLRGGRLVNVTLTASSSTALRPCWEPLRSLALWVSMEVLASFASRYRTAIHCFSTVRVSTGFWELLVLRVSGCSVSSRGYD